MSEKIIMLSIVLVAVAVVAAVFIHRAVCYRRKMRETTAEAISPQEIDFKMTTEDISRETGNYYRDFFFHLADSSTCNAKDIRIQPKYHTHIKAIVRNARKMGIHLTIYSYLDNVLEHHFQSFGEEITNLHLKKDDND